MGREYGESMIFLLVFLIIGYCDAGLEKGRISPDNRLASIAKRPKIVDRRCPDEEIGLICDSQCFSSFEECVESCETSSCERSCLYEYTSCYVDCPCFENCPNGCDGCPNSLCSCSNAETDNDDYKQCISQSSQRFNQCVEGCPPDEMCFDVCIEDFKDASRKCPCMSACKWGCPCNDDSTCQEHIMSLCQIDSLNDGKAANYSYIISADGLFQENRYFTTPPAGGSNYYNKVPFLHRSGFALVNGKILFFGGEYDKKMVAQLDECEIQPTSMRLIYDYDYTSTLVVIPNNSGSRLSSDEVILCTSNSCQDFYEFRRTATQIADTQSYHQRGCMGLYQGKPLIVAGGTARVEHLYSSEWVYKNSYYQSVSELSCLTVENAVITTGGVSENTNVYMFRDEDWSEVGQLINTYRYGSMIAVQGGFLIFDGVPFSTENSNMIERVEWDGQRVVLTRNLAQQPGNCYRPALFLTSPGTCKSFCSDDFCYF
ncbi:Oidioi.mRNA.OKI2018_I69.chr2.g4273.t1.cds [Oikopleura dioica]|uniref:Oidioi.mRNA.OKI2018_I69.chr2.g4273.t1.cds n=1 Tax=Oikopleura dioica TaxID=34765 RepID=A0ABN7SYF2_OIKDI|nr:Oidioi.mRNA.OKI2018_I69.chr2.g4273.t1.cds [Oikopleura dioica]